MTKKDCQTYVYAWTTASKGTEQIKIWFGMYSYSGEKHYFLDNGAECTHLIYEENNELWYKGGGWLEKLLGNSFKGTSEDVDKLQKWILYGSLTIVLLILTAPKIYQFIKSKNNG